MLTRKLSAAGLAIMACCLLCQNVLSQGVDPVELFKQLDTNNDGVITADEVPDEKKNSFDRLLRIGDVDQNKELTQKEVSDALSDDKSMPKKTGKNQPSERRDAGGRQQASNGPGQRPSGQGGQARGQQGGQRPGGQSRGGGGTSVSPDELLSRFDENKDGKLTVNELPEQATRLMQMMKDADKNQDKSVSKKELEDYFSTLGGQGSGQQPGGRQPSGQSGGSQRPGGMQPGQGGQGGGFGQRGGGPGQAGQRRGGGGRSISPDAILGRFDANKDGKLSADEIPSQAGRLAQMMKDADKNEDGTVTKQELTQYLASSGRGQPMRGGRPSAGGGGSGRGGGGFGANIPEVGQNLPDVTAYTSDGETIQLSELKGNYCVLVFGCLT